MRQEYSFCFECSTLDFLSVSVSSESIPIITSIPVEPSGSGASGASSTYDLLSSGSGSGKTRECWERNERLGKSGREKSDLEGKQRERNKERECEMDEFFPQP